jgi:hypothetical protein
VKFTGKPDAGNPHVRFDEGEGPSLPTLLVKNKMDLNDITYRINGSIYEVNQVLGSGFLEKVHPAK